MPPRGRCAGLWGRSFSIPIVSAASVTVILLFGVRRIFFLSHGVIAAVLLLLLFWVGAANWQRISSLFGGGPSNSAGTLECYEVVSCVTQLPPPPPLHAPPPSPPSKVVAPSPAVPNVGKIKKVKESEVPADQTMATQKEIRQAIQAGDGAGDDVPSYVACDKMPGFLDQKKPRYPEMARIAGIEGKVFVSVLVAEDGRPMKSKVMKRIPADCTVFDEVAIRSVMESRYYPAVQAGRPIRVWFTVPIRFQID